MTLWVPIISWGHKTRIPAFARSPRALWHHQVFCDTSTLTYMLWPQTRSKRTLLMETEKKELEVGKNSFQNCLEKWSWSKTGVTCFRSGGKKGRESKESGWLDTTVLGSYNFKNLNPTSVLCGALLLLLVYFHFKLWDKHGSFWCFVNSDSKWRNRGEGWAVKGQHTTELNLVLFWF